MIPIHIPKTKRILNYKKWNKEDTKWSLFIVFVVIPIWYALWYVIFKITS
jgi:hypothetical protein